MACKVPRCKNVKRLNNPESGITFHRFPKGERFKIFKEIIGLPDLQWGPRKYICSDHFLDTDFYPGEKRILKNVAVPSKHLFQMEVCEASSGTSCRSKSKHELPSNETGHKILLRTRAVTPSSTATLSSPDRKLPSSSSPTASSVTSSPCQNKETFRKPVITESPPGTSSASTSSSVKQKRVALVRSLHSYSLSPGKERKKSVETKKKCKKLVSALYKSRKKVQNLQKKITSLQQIADDLKAKEMISVTGLDQLQRIANEVPKDLLSRFLKNVERGSTSREEYPPSLKKFAMTLQFFSCRAYEYVRETFNLSLPHQVTLRKWCATVECEPGFSQICFDLLKSIRDKSESNLICSLLFDEMAIKKKIEFDGKKTWGYVDFGIHMEDDDVEPASEVLVLMIVCHTGSWKLPLGYFFIKSLTGQEKCNIIREALVRLNDVNVDVPSVTCDGPATNFSMFRELGCNWDDLNNIKSFFLHPSTSTKIYAVIDVCHLLKLVRNNFAYLKIMFDENKEAIEWKYIKDLHNIQEQEGLRAGNKLKTAHINWENQKMKVSLAAQTLSGSVADSLEFLKEDLKLENFKNCQGTVRFIRIINQLFDILNSKNPFAKGYKSALRKQNKCIWQEFLVETQKYLLSLKDSSGTYLWETKKKTPFLGFALTIQSVLGIFYDYVETERLKYFLTYKISQDHLEMFFCSIRSRNGWNNNPTCLQFYHSYRKLLLHARIPGEGGNCRVLDTTHILDIGEKNIPIHTEDVLHSRKYYIEIEETSALKDHDYDILNIQLHLDTYVENVVTYISGYVIKMMYRIIKCETCLSSLLPNETHSIDYRLIERKNRGGLLLPSKAVKDICMYVEKYFRKLLSLNDNKIPRDKNLITALVSSIYENFSMQNMHNLDKYFPMQCMETIFEDHRISLIKSLIDCYCKIRIYNLCKKYSADIVGPQIRSKFNKIILFRHQ